MSANTSISWTDRTWNPLIAYGPDGKRGWFCTHASPGCKFCYAERINLRLGNGLHYIAQNLPKIKWALVNIDAPLKWRTPGMVFVNSMTDLFHPDVPITFTLPIFETMGRATSQTFQVLTKHPDRALYCLAYPDDQLVCESAEHHRLLCTMPLANVWMGVSVEDRERKSRIDVLRKIPAAVRFLSIEPLLEDIGELNLTNIDWVIVGSESGRGARPCNEDWVRAIQRQCESSGVAFFYKQKTVNGKKVETPLLDGRTWKQFPNVVPA